MRHERRFGLKFLKLALPLFLGVLGILGSTGPQAAWAKDGGLGQLLGLGTGTSLAGDWRWEEHILVILPGDVAMAYFGVANSEGPIMILRCVTWGEMTLTQAGDDFSGFASQSSSCETLGGQTAASPPFPPGFGVSGSIRGHSVSFSADVGGGIDCSYRGVAYAWLGEAFAVNASGGCDVPAPFEPNISKSISFDMYRQ